MIKRWKKIGWRIFFSLVIAGSVIFVIPLLLESYLSRTLDLKGVRDALVDRVSANPDLRLRIQGVRFSLAHGIIFSGVSLDYAPANETGKTILKTENMVLSVSYIDLLRNRTPFDRLSVHQGHLNPWAMNHGQWIKLIQMAYQSNPESKDVKIGNGAHARVPDQISPGSNEIPPDFLMEDVELDIPERIATTTEPSDLITMNLEVDAAPEGYQIRFHFKTESKKNGDGELDGRGEWLSGANRDLFITYENISADLIYRLISELDLFPTTIPGPKIMVEMGSLSGTGSLKLYPTGAGLGVDFKGRYENLTMDLPAENPLFHINKSSGDFSYNTGIYADSGSPAYITFQMSQEDLLYKTLYRNDKGIPTSENRLEIDGFVMLSDTSEDKPGAISSAFPGVSGRVDYSIKGDARRDGDAIHPVIDLKVKDFALNMDKRIDDGSIRTIATSLLNKEDISGKIVVNDLDIHINDKGSGKIKGNGSIFAAPFILAGDTQVKLQIDNRPEGGEELIVNHNSRLETDLDGWSYRNVAEHVAKVSSRIIDAGFAPGAPISEDAGPVWKNKFTDTTLFRQIIGPMTLHWTFRLHNMKNASNLPVDPVIEVTKVGTFAKLALVPSSENLAFSYSAGFDSSLPRHDLQFKINWKDPYLPPSILPAGIGQPGAIQIGYRYNGEGVLPGDLAHRSYSSLTLDIENLSLKDSSAGRIAAYSLNLGEDDLNANTLRIRRYTDGINMQLQNVFFESGTLSASGSGSYDPVMGGEVKLNYVMKEPANQERGSLTYKVKEDGTWLPSSDF